LPNPKFSTDEVHDYSAGITKTAESLPQRSQMPPATLPPTLIGTPHGCSFMQGHGKRGGKTFATAEPKAQPATTASSATTLSPKRSRRAGKNTPQPNTAPTQSASGKISQAKRL
jgi:hypothetical protein